MLRRQKSTKQQRARLRVLWKEAPSGWCTTQGSGFIPEAPKLFVSSPLHVNVGYINPGRHRVSLSSVSCSKKEGFYLALKVEGPTWGLSSQLSAILRSLCDHVSQHATLFTAKKITSQKTQSLSTLSHNYFKFSSVSKFHFHFIQVCLFCFVLLF